MTKLEVTVAKLRADAARCERLCAGAYDPALSAQLLDFASEFRHRAAVLEQSERSERLAA